MPDIPPVAGLARLQRAQAAMADRGLAGLLLVSGANLAYLTGYPIIERTLARPFFCLVPAHAPPILIVHTARRLEALRLSWIEDVRTYDRLSVAPLTEIVNALADAGIDHGRLGAEIGFEQRLGVPELEFQRICHAVAPRQIVDAADLLWSLRRLKASDEIAAMRRACQATARAYAEVLPRLRPGMAERQVVTRLKIAMLRHGGVDPWVSITSGASSYEIIAQPGSDRELQLGDMVWVDSGCQVSGYWSDFSRAAVLGAATCEQRDLQTAIHEATMAGVALARTGVPVAEIAAAAEERLQQLAVPITAHISGLAGRSGHGVGLDVTEPPSIAATDRSVLEAGMVITVEPGVATSFGTFHVEEQILVTDTKPDILSASPWALVETSRCVADSRGVT